jgi:putative heme-binding domain-containing protein
MSRTVRAWPLVLLLATPALAQRDAKIPDPDPEIERRSFQVAEGFEVNLYAADPLIAKPIQMNFDPQGRLWIVSSEVYPQILPGQEANDRVLILEDADGDGRAETTTVFADGLLIPTGIEPGDGGAYVANSTELLHFRDTDGDGKADSKRIILSGFGTEDTHHILHTLRWGFDGQLYMNQSIYIHSHIETPHGVRRLNGGGIWEFRPETRELAVFIHGLVNPWGHHFDRWGQSFATDGAGGEGINYALPGAYYVSAPDAVRILQGLNPGSPKHCGLEVVDGRHLPDDWQGNLITNDFRANRVCRFVVSDDGAGFASREQPELIRATHPAFRPIDVKMGPDGAIYVADWYNPIIQHGEVDFRDPRRDHTRGRIWRVTAKGRPLVERPRLVGAPVESLLDALRAPEGWTRRQASRVLKERGAAEVLPALAAWVERLDPNDPEFEQGRLEALWAYQSLDVPEPGLLERVLGSPDPRARAAGVRVLQHWADRVSHADELLARLVEDEHPRVRLEAVRALARRPSVRSAEVAMRALDRPVDRFLEYALWLTARELAPSWLPAVQDGSFDFGGQTRHLVFAINAVGSPAAVGRLVESLRQGRIADAQRDRALAVVASLGGPEELAFVLDAALGDQATGRVGLLETLGESARRRKARPSGDLSRIAPLLASADPALRGAAARLAGAWGLEALRPRLVELARDERSEDAVQAAAIEGLLALGAGSRDALEALSGPGSRPALRRRAVAALASLDTASAARRAVAVLRDTPANEDPSAVFEAFLSRRDGPDALTAALADATLPPDVARIGARLARGSGADHPALVEALTKAGRLAGRSPLPTGAQREALLAEVAANGDPARGEAVFRRKGAACLKCHAIAGAGGQVGPGLESIGASAPVDYLLDSILEPGKAVKENYHATVVATADGRIVTGVKVRQTDDALWLRDAEDREVSIPLADVEEQKTAGSLMPDGQAEDLTRAELVDLVRFLSSLGKPGPFAAGPKRLARRWQVFEPAGTGADGPIDPFEALKARDDPRWRPLYATVAGLVPAAELATFPTIGGSRASLVRCQVDVTQGGPVRLVIAAPPGSYELWAGGRRIEPGAEERIELPPGRHDLAFLLKTDTLGKGLSCELQDVPGSTARAQFVLGK